MLSSSLLLLCRSPIPWSRMPWTAPPQLRMTSSTAAATTTIPSLSCGTSSSSSSWVFLLLLVVVHQVPTNVSAKESNRGAIHGTNRWDGGGENRPLPLEDDDDDKDKDVALSRMEDVTRRNRYKQRIHQHHHPPRRRPDICRLDGRHCGCLLHRLTR